MEFFEDRHLELYNLGEDIGETTNQLESQPQKAAELHAALLAWRENTHAPMPSENVPKPAETKNGKGSKKRELQEKKPAENE